MVKMSLSLIILIWGVLIFFKTKNEILGIVESL